MGEPLSFSEIVLTLGELDQKILGHLERDARQPNALIARAVGVSEATVRRRIQNLIKEEAFYISAVPEAAKIGFNLSALVGFTVEPNGLERASGRLVAFPEIIFLGSATGPFDLLAEVVVKDQEDLRDFLSRISREIPDLRQAEPIGYLWPRPDATPHESPRHLRARMGP